MQNQGFSYNHKPYRGEFDQFGGLETGRGKQQETMRQQNQHQNNNLQTYNEFDQQNGNNRMQYESQSDRRNQNQYQYSAQSQHQYEYKYTLQNDNQDNYHDSHHSKSQDNSTSNKGYQIEEEIFQQNNQKYQFNQQKQEIVNQQRYNNQNNGQNYRRYEPTNDYQYQEQQQLRQSGNFQNQNNQQHHYSQNQQDNQNQYQQNYRQYNNNNNNQKDTRSQTFADSFPQKSQLNIPQQYQPYIDKPQSENKQFNNYGQYRNNNDSFLRNNQNEFPQQQIQPGIIPYQNNNSQNIQNNSEFKPLINYQTNTNSSINSLSFQFKMPQHNNPKSFNLLNQLIQAFFSQCDIEITFKNMNQQLIQEIPKLENALQDYNFQKHFHQEQDNLEQQNIYQLKGQNDNNISPQDQRIYINSLINELEEEAKKKSLQILINSKAFQYKIVSINEINQNVIKNFFQKFKKTITENIVLIYQSKTKFEAKIKTQILSKVRNQNELKKQLNCTRVIIDDTVSLKIDQIGNEDLQEYAQKMQQQTSQIICIVQTQNTQNIKKLQEKFEQFIENNDYIKQINEQFDFQVSFIPNLDEIHKQIEKLQDKEQVEIIVCTPQTNFKSGKLNIQVELTIITEGYQTNVFIDTQIKRIRDTIISFYIPNITIKIQQQDQIEIWQEFLSQKYESKNNFKDCQTKMLNQNDMIIELNGDYQSIQQKNELINQDFQKYALFNCISNVIDKQILKPLEGKQYPKLFKKVLQDLWINTFGDGFIRLKNVQANQSLITIMIIYDQTIIQENNIEEFITSHFTEKLKCYEEQLDFDEFLKFIGLSESQLQDQKQIVVNKFKKKYQFVGLEQNIKEIKDIIEQLKQRKEQSKITQTIEIDHQLIISKLKLFHSNQTIPNLPEKSTIIFLDNKIRITQDKAQIDQAKNAIQEIINDLKKQLIQSQITFSEKEINYIFKKLQPKITELKQTYECLIEFRQNLVSTKPQKAIASSICYDNKTLSIVHADISQLECEAIVNSCNNKMSFGDPSKLSGVAQQIFNIAGTSYHAFCAEYIERNKELQIGKAITYDMPMGRHIKYVINIATPIYTKGSQTQKDFEDIKKNIQAIFGEANQKGINVLALPILGAGACGYSFQETAILVVNEVINQHFSQQSNIKTVYLVEIYQQRVESMKTILKQVTAKKQEQKLIKFQWQWQDNQFKDYDDEDINKQIDEGYEEFLKTNQETKVQLKFSFSKQPGTHNVDFNQMTITDIALNKTQQIHEQIVNNSQRFFINDQQIDDQLNEYFVLQKMNKQYTFQIFYKRHTVIFNQQQMYQINEETQFTRPIQNIPYNKPQKNKNAKQNILQGKQIQLQNFEYEKFVHHKSQNQELLIESYDGSINQKIIKTLQQEINKEIIDYKLDIPNLSQDDLIDFEQFLISISVSIQGQIVCGNQIVMKIFKNKEQKVKQRISQINATIKQYPKTWTQQSENCTRVLLNKNSQEYQNIQNIFQQTEQGTIYAIYRIQNKALWDNYIHDKNKLIEYYKSQGQTLNKLEEERYLWHGVRGQHPKIIYSGLREAFDPSFSNTGMWGQGIYFAQRASYSRHYSYTLQATDDKLLAGKLVFLCCLVTTGRVEQRQPDNSIRRPSAGYDCVTGFTNGSDVFMLYSMDIRRAYPAYEIVYS